MSDSTKQEAIIEDFLDEDTEIPGQKVVLLSFLSPEKVLEKKELFFFQKFLQSYEVDWKVKNLEKFLIENAKKVNDELEAHAVELEKKDQYDAAQICRKNCISIAEIMSSYETFIQKSRNELNKTVIANAHDDFMYQNKKKLEEEFYELNQFRTSIRGVKVRGVYSNVKEAELKAKKLQNKDKYHNIYMAEVGKWTPWDPEAHEIKEQSYNNDQLNTLMSEYRKNEDSREKFFEERTRGSSAKPFFGSSALSSDSSSSASASASVSASSSGVDAVNSMFGSTDLALQRKMENATLEEEKGSDASEENKKDQ
jgi:hypothetical protein